MMDNAHIMDSGATAKNSFEKMSRHEQKRVKCCSVCLFRNIQIRVVPIILLKESFYRGYLIDSLYKGNRDILKR